MEVKTSAHSFNDWNYPKAFEHPQLALVTEASDLSDHVYPASLAVAKGEADRGIFIDGVGYGSALIANKIYGLNAVVCQDPFCARLARELTDSNILCIGGKIIGSAIALEIVTVWMNTDFLSGIENMKDV